MGMVYTAFNFLKPIRKTTPKILFYLKTVKLF